MHTCTSCLARAMTDARAYTVHGFSVTFVSITNRHACSTHTACPLHAFSENATRIRLPRANALGNYIKVSTLQRERE